MLAARAADGDAIWNGPAVHRKRTPRTAAACSPSIRHVTECRPKEMYISGQVAPKRGT